MRSIRSPIKAIWNQKLAFMGLLLAFTLILSYVESLIPFYFGVPGIKPGLANLAVILTLYLYGTKEALLLNFMRVLLAGFLFGNLYMIAYSMTGAICSFIIMVILKKTGKFSIAGVSMAGGVFHNIGQVMLAAWVVDTLGVLYYLPALLIAGIVAGGLNGVLAYKLRPYLSRILT